MIRILSVTLSNFFSVGQAPQTIDLSGIGMTMVLGRNDDVGAANARNGVGKTTLAQAISYGLYGEPLTRIKLDNLINNINGRGMLVVVRFSRDAVTYRVERGRKPDLLRFFVDDAAVTGDGGEVNEARGGNKFTQAEINRVLGMTHALFKHLVMLNTYTMPFLRAEAAEQRKVIEELFGIGQLSLRDEVLKQRMVTTKEIIRDAETALKTIGETNARIEQAIITETVQRLAWQKSQAATLARLDRDIAAVSAIDFTAEMALFEQIDIWDAADRDLRAERRLCQTAIEATTREAASLDAEIARQRQSSTADVEAQIRRLQADLLACEAAGRQTPEAQIARLTSDITRKQAAITAITHRIGAILAEQNATRAAIENADQDVCVTCGQGLSGTDHLVKVLDNLRATDARLEHDMRSHHAEATGLRLEIADLEAAIADVRREHATMQAAQTARGEDLRREIAAAQTLREAQQAATLAATAKLTEARQSLTDVLAEQRRSMQTIEAALAAHGARPQSRYERREDVWTLRAAAEALTVERDREAVRQNPHEATIASLRATLQPVDARALEAAQLDLKHQDFLHRLLSGKESFIRKRLIDQNLTYLNQLMNHYLEALDLPHEVQFCPDLSVEIGLLGRDFDFEQLSRGEMNRVILAMSWGFRDIWESLNTGLNLLLVDELADNGLDDAGSEAIVAILHKMSSQHGRDVFLISHKEFLIARVKRILLVQKENQFTKFTQDAVF